MIKKSTKKKKQKYPISLKYSNGQFGFILDDQQMPILELQFFKVIIATFKTSRVTVCPQTVGALMTCLSQDLRATVSCFYLEHREC